ncbi:hypothetical protein KOR42_39750 [Thalassoglobus neptunius]|uniref:Uncharacterized protein n=1 Tax=Thalassoglobus neptunius TaxID=1938619 RepID=A0A5C5WDR4_9PLAN|nr:hypothetical protein [Thalassoglobus neptunius]TWT49058.1 hypothetical protein KOR42_39750 [Thalassoglobus neptunius]
MEDKRFMLREASGDRDVESIWRQAVDLNWTMVLRKILRKLAAS